MATYNPYTAVNAIYKLKGQWADGNSSGDINKKNSAATSATDFYKELRDNGYGDVADRLQSSDYTAAKKINDEYAKKYLNSNSITSSNSSSNKTSTLTSADSGVKNDAYNESMTSATLKNNTLYENIQSDRKDVQSKYDDIYKYANSDITETDEYKSAFKNIMPSYTLAALQGRENEVASVGASNGGNIDSFAAANALRQQSALTAKGQQLAHQMGLDAYNSRVQNVQNILSNLGVYNQGTYNAMNQSIQNDVGIANTYFENAETAKNNEVARKSEIAKVTGYVPDEWVLSNNFYLNDDGTLKEQYKDVDFKAALNTARENGASQDAINQLLTARAVKLYGDYANLGQYDDGDYLLPGIQKTAASDQFDKTMDYNYATLGIEKESEAEIKYNADKNISDWLYGPLAIDGENNYKQYNGTESAQRMALEKIKDPTVVAFLKYKLEESGYSAAEAQKKIEEYRNNIAKEVAMIEGMSPTDDVIEQILSGNTEQ